VEVGPALVEGGREGATRLLLLLTKDSWRQGPALGVLTGGGREGGDWEVMEGGSCAFASFGRKPKEDHLILC
jgi:hypothetical protein